MPGPPTPLAEAGRKPGQGPTQFAVHKADSGVEGGVLGMELGLVQGQTPAFTFGFSAMNRWTVRSAREFSAFSPRKTRSRFDSRA